MRPNSIVQFERLFFASLVARILNDLTAVNAGLGAARSDALLTTYGLGAVLAAMGVVYAAMLALWYFAARRRSSVAKWIVSIWFVVATCTVALGLYKGAYGLDVRTALAVGGFLLFGWSVSYLFKPDADGWFTKDALDRGSGERP